MQRVWTVGHGMVVQAGVGMTGQGYLMVVVVAVYRRWRHLAFTALLLGVLVYVYSVLAFVFFRQLAVVDVDRGYVSWRCCPPTLPLTL